MNKNVRLEKQTKGFWACVKEKTTKAVSSIREFMRNLIILVKMQLKQRLNFKRFEIEKVTWFQILLSVLGEILKLALVIGLCAVFLIACELLPLFSPRGIPAPIELISIVFFAMLVVSVVSCTVGLTNSMYYSRDNAVLLTLPCLPMQVYLSKLIIFFVFEIKRNFSFIVPLFVAYFITNGYSVWAYLWLIPCILTLSLFTVSVGAVFSIPAMWVANFFRQRRWLQMGGLVTVVAVAVVLVFWGISLIPENIDLVETWGTTYWQIQDFINGFAKVLPFTLSLATMFLGRLNSTIPTLPFGEMALTFAILIGITLVLLALGLLVVQPMFYKMASTPFEYLKKVTRPRPNRVRPRRVSAVYNEFLIAVKSSARMFENVGILISVPMLIFLLNKIFLAMKTRELGDNMIIAFNVLIILLVLLNANCYASSIFSRDGRSNYLIKTQPSKYPILVLSKLLPNTVFAIGSMIATYVIMLLTTTAGALNITLLMLSIGMTYLTHMLYCAELDLMNPQVELYASVGNTESNPNETNATVTAFIASFVIAVVIFLVLLDPTSSSVYVKYLIVALIAVIYKTYIFFAKLRLYYKEKG